MISTTKNHLLFAFIAIGTLVTSCEKERIVINKAELSAIESLEKGSDEDPIIRVRVKKKKSSSFVVNASVEIINSETEVRVASVYTDNNGEFEQQVSAGKYYFRIRESGATTISVTDPVLVGANTELTLYVD